MTHAVVVIGGGPAAAAVVLALLGKQFPVTWLLSVRHQKQAFGEHLSPEGIVPIAQLGIQEILDPMFHLQASGVVSFWGGDEAYERDYIFNPFGMGWNLDRRRFDQYLVDKAIERGANVLHIQQLFLGERQRGTWSLRIRDSAGSAPKPMKASFLVDATGRNAFISRRLGVRPARLDRMIALFSMTTVLPPSEIANNRLMIEPMLDGWWYSLVLRDHRLVAAYLTDADIVPSGKIGLNRFFEERLRGSLHTRDRVACFDASYTLCAIPAHSQFLSPAGGDGWLAVGDACMAFDPLAAGGITKAFRDGLLAEKVIDDALGARGDSIKEYTLVKCAAYTRYRNERREYYQSEKRWPNNPFWERRQRLD